MKIGEEIKICFLPIGTIFTHSEYGRGQFLATNKRMGETPGNHSNGWFSNGDLNWWIKWVSDHGAPVRRHQSLSHPVTIIRFPDAYQTEPEQPKRSSNVERNIAALMREDAKTVEVNFNDGSKSYTYITSLDIKVGDHAVVDCGGDDFKVVQVLEVHDDVEIEPNSDTKFKWLVAKFDLDHYKSNEAKNEQIEKVMATGYRTNIRRQFAASVMACLSDEKKAELTAIVSGEQVVDAEPARRTRKKAS